MFEHNCEIHTVNTRNKTNLHLPHLKLQTVPKGVFFFRIQIYNDHPSNIESVIHDKRNLKLP